MKKNIDNKQDELNLVKEQVRKRLNKLGYDGDAFANNIVKISAYFHGSPSRVIMTDGTEIFL